MNDPKVTYEQFRTGLKYSDVYAMIFHRKHKRRNGVLGFWRELKLKMYADYLNGVEAPEYVCSNDPIPE